VSSNEAATFLIVDVYGNVIGLAEADSYGHILFPRELVPLRAGSYPYTLYQSEAGVEGFDEGSDGWPVVLTVEGPENSVVSITYSYPQGKRAAAARNEQAAPALSGEPAGVSETAEKAAEATQATEDDAADTPKAVEPEPATDAEGQSEEENEAGKETDNETDTESENGESPEEAVEPEPAIAPGPAVAQIYAKVCNNGACAAGSALSFGLYDQNRSLIEEVASDDCGNIQFEVSFAEAGVYHYTVKQLSPALSGWRIDKRRLPVTITVEEAPLLRETGAEPAVPLHATVSYPIGDICFVNTFYGLLIGPSNTRCFSRPAQRCVSLISQPAPRRGGCPRCR